jgi:hypothetical protein
LAAAFRFSARIDSEPKIAAAPDIWELSLCGGVPPSRQTRILTAACARILYYPFHFPGGFL